jgi:hypothetical protein
MKHIKIFEKFDNKTKVLEDKIKNDIDGILIELLDKGFRTYKKIEINNYKGYESYFHFKIDMKPVTGYNGYKKQFKYEEVKDYIHTVIDYLKYAINDNINISFEVSSIYKIFNKEHYMTEHSEPNNEKEVNSIELKISYDDDEIH